MLETVVGGYGKTDSDIGDVNSKYMWLSVHRAVLNVCVAYTSRDEMCSAMKDVAEGVSRQLIYPRYEQGIHRHQTPLRYPNTASGSRLKV